MFTKADLKLVKSLGEKNLRHANKLFVAEGSKSVTDLLASPLKVAKIFALQAWINQQPAAFLKQTEVCQVTAKELEQMSSLKSTRELIGLFHLPEPQFQAKDMKGLILALDTLQDPGNLGTLIRLADWYGIQHILCSNQTVDCFNAKVIQSTMGSIGRVKLHYGDLADFIKELQLPVFAASMEGSPSRNYKFPSNMVLLLGNEGSGISEALRAKVTQTISIEKRGEAESLNVAMAGAILIDRYFGQ